MHWAAAPWETPKEVPIDGFGIVQFYKVMKVNPGIAESVLKSSVPRTMLKECPGDAGMDFRGGAEGCVGDQSW